MLSSGLQGQIITPPMTPRRGEPVSGDGYLPLAEARTLSDTEHRSSKQCAHDCTLKSGVHHLLSSTPGNTYTNVADCRCRGNYDRLLRVSRDFDEVGPASSGSTTRETDPRVGTGVVAMETHSLSPTLGSEGERPFSDCTDKDLPVIIITEGSTE